MLKLTKTGIGLLTRLYRSVLHKCFLINVGAFALGAAVAMTPSTAEAGVLCSVNGDVVYENAATCSAGLRIAVISDQILIGGGQPHQA